MCLPWHKQKFIDFCKSKCNNLGSLFHIERLNILCVLFFLCAFDVMYDTFCWSPFTEITCNMFWLWLGNLNLALCLFRIFSVYFITPRTISFIPKMVLYFCFNIPKSKWHDANRETLRGCVRIMEEGYKDRMLVSKETHKSTGKTQKTCRLNNIQWRKCFS